MQDNNSLYIFAISIALIKYCSRFKYFNFNAAVQKVIKNFTGKLKVRTFSNKIIKN